jgi:hypothetical protein
MNKFDLNPWVFMNYLVALLIATLNIIPKLSPKERHIINNLTRAKVRLLRRPNFELYNLVRRDLLTQKEADGSVELFDGIIAHHDGIPGPQGYALKNNLWGPSLKDAEANNHANPHMQETSRHIIHYLLVASLGY